MEARGVSLRYRAVSTNRSFNLLPVVTRPVLPPLHNPCSINPMYPFTHATQPTFGVWKQNLGSLCKTPGRANRASSPFIDSRSSGGEEISGPWNFPLKHATAPLTLGPPCLQSSTAREIPPRLIPVQGKFGSSTDLPLPSSSTRLRMLSSPRLSSPAVPTSKISATNFPAAANAQMPEPPSSPRNELQRLSLDEMRSPRASYTINADIQARVMAFQEQRQGRTPQEERDPLRGAHEHNEQWDLSPRGQLSRAGSQRKEKPLPPLPPVPTDQKSNEARATQGEEEEEQRPQPRPQTKQPQQSQQQRLNPQRPAPALPTLPGLKLNLSPSPQQAARLPKAKQSLSMRRGMKLPGGLPGQTPEATPGLTSNADNLETSTKGKSSIAELIDKRGKLPEPQQQQLKGLFANYSKYVDIKSGSLNFAGKLSLNSTGMNFNGTKFNISADDLEFIEELGRGNYGTVSKVTHKPTGIIMAMKEVRLELDDSKFRQILMELEVLHKCNSPFIVDFYGAFFVEGAVYMCMEFMDGGSLDKIYGSGVDEEHAKFITESVIRGLKELKEGHNVIHRDVKPTNILVNTAGKVKLCDFGVSGNLVASLAKTNIGCQSYMAPERIKSFSPDDVAYTVQSDIWSLGLSILETAKGCYPYPPETYNNIFSQLSAIVDGDPPSLPDGYSPLAKDFVAHCLDKIPERRPNYSKLLLHPWLAQVCSEEDMSKYVQMRIKEHKTEKNQRDKEDYEELNQKLKPPLHRGGAPQS